MIRKLKSGKYRLYSRKVDPKSLRHSHRGQSLLAAKPFSLFATVVILIEIQCLLLYIESLGKSLLE